MMDRVSQQRSPIMRVRCALIALTLVVVAVHANAQGHRLDTGALATEVIVYNQDGTTATFNTVSTYLQPGSGAQIQSDNTNNDDETEIKATAGVLLSISGRNVHASTDAFVRCTNLTAANTTPGSSTVIYELYLPHGGGWVNGSIGPGGLTFSVALTCYTATGKALSDATDPAQDDVHVNVVYR